ncbi:MAG: tyrosyl-tRNA synthetase [Flavobacteriaceae bacterium]|jgi:tyrosyl-tRNA synthetase
MNIVEELEKRGLVYQKSTETLDEILKEKRTLYLGFEPSADSLHVGNLVPFILARHLFRHGHKVVLLVGGATAQIGDPSGKDAEREFVDIETIQTRTEKITEQIQKLIGEEEIEVVNNMDWIGEMNILEFLRDVGKHFTVNSMIKKDSVSRRLDTEQGISFTEFSYSLLQGYDFYHLYKEHGVDLQIGGSDQWGNIVSGIDLTRRHTGSQVYGVTTPLVVDKATGKKFGKSEGNAVWIDGDMTSPYDFYQFWLNLGDEGIFDYIKLFTFVPLEEIEKLEQKHSKNPEERNAQKTLAFEMTSLIHGVQSAHSAGIVSDILFSGMPVDALEDQDVEMLMDVAPSFEIKETLILSELLISSELASSKREAKEFISSGAIKIDGGVVDEDIEILPFGQLRILSRGKKNKCILYS